MTIYEIVWSYQLSRINERSGESSKTGKIVMESVPRSLNTFHASDAFYVHRKYRSWTKESSKRGNESFYIFVTIFMEKNPSSSLNEY